MGRCLFFFIFLLSGVVRAQVPLVKVWDSTLGGNAFDRLAGLESTPDGGFILGGFTGSAVSNEKGQPNNGPSDFWLVKTDSLGLKQWDRTFGGSSLQYLSVIKVTSDGGYVLGGSSDSPVSGTKTEPNRGMRDFWLIKTDSQGNKQWEKVYGGSADDEMSKLLLLPDGGFLLGGYSESGISADKSQPGKGLKDFWLIRTDSLGNKQWDKTLGGTYDDVLTTLIATQDGNYIAGGTSFSDQTGDRSEPTRGSSDYWFLKLDTLGNKIWDKRYGGSLEDELSGLIQTGDGGFLLSGGSYSMLSGDKTEQRRILYDYWLVKTNSLGQKLWDRTYGGNGYDHAPRVLELPNHDLLVAGSAFSNATYDKSVPTFGNYDFWVLQLSPTGAKRWDKGYGGGGSEFLSVIQTTPDNNFILAGSSNSGVSATKSQSCRGAEDFWLLKLTATPTVSGLPEANPAAFSLSQNSPNPFSENTRITFTLPKPAPVAITVYNQLGKEVASCQKEVAAGETSVTWREMVGPENLPGGIYFYQLTTAGFQTTRKMILQKR